MFITQITLIFYWLKNNYTSKTISLIVFLIFNITLLHAQENQKRSLIKIDTVLKDLKHELNKASISKNTAAIVTAHIQLAHFYEILGIEIAIFAIKLLNILSMLRTTQTNRHNFGLYKQ